MFPSQISGRLLEVEKIAYFRMTWTRPTLHNPL